MPTRDIGWAIRGMKQSRECFTRKGWNGKDMWIGLHKPLSGEAMDFPFIYMKVTQGSMIPWSPSQVDLLAEDWERVG